MTSLLVFLYSWLFSLFEALLAKLTLLDFGSDFQSKQNLNANNDLIEAALEKTLSRDGTSPNQMSADFDMNNHQILNLPPPVNPTDPVRLIDGSSAATYIATAQALSRLVYDTKVSAAAATIPSAVSSLLVNGFATVGDAGESLLYKKVGSAPGTHALYFTSADGAIWEYQPSLAGVNLVAAGATTAATDNSTAWAAARTYSAQTTNKFMNTVLPAGKNFNFTAQITYDGSIGGCKLNGGKLTFNILSAVNAIKVANSNPLDGSNYYNARSVFEGGMILGPSLANTAGLYFVPTGGQSSAHLFFKNLTILGFARGIELSANAYLLTFDGVDVLNCTGAVQDNGTQANSGERITFNNCNFFNNSGRAVDLSNNSGDYNFLACSFDYNGSAALTTDMIRLLGTRANFVGCHFESGSATSTPVLFQIGKDASLTPAYVTVSNSYFAQTLNSGVLPYIDVKDGGVLRLVAGTANVNNSTTTALKIRSGGTCSRHGFDFLTSALITNDGGSTYANYP